MLDGVAFRAVFRFLSTADRHGDGRARAVFSLMLTRNRERTARKVPFACRFCGERDGKRPVLKACRFSCGARKTTVRYAEGIRTGNVPFRASTEGHKDRYGWWFDEAYFRAAKWQPLDFGVHLPFL